MSRSTEKKCCVILYLALFLFFCWFAYQIPFELDDWAWGSNLGLERLAEGFANENGRYAGNLTILVLLRHTAVRVLLPALTDIGIIFGLADFFSKTEKKSLLTMTMLCFVLFFAVPKRLFCETYAWYSGFTNYVLPLPFLILSCVLLSKATEEEPQMPLCLSWVLLPLGFLDCLFVEHNSVYVLTLAVAAVGYIFWKTRRLTSAQLFFLAGALAGNLLMFTNPSYVGGGAATGYKHLTFDAGFIVRKYFTTMSDLMFFENLLVNLFLGIAAVLLLENALRKKSFDARGRIVRRAALLLIFAFLSYNLLSSLEPDWYVLSWPGNTTCVNGFFFFVFIGTVWWVFLSHLEDKRAKGRLAFFFCSAVYVMLPLLVAEPVEPRCFLTSYFFLGCFAIDALTSVFDQLKVKFDWNTVLVPAMMVFLLFYFSIFEDIGKASRMQVEHMLQDVESGAEDIYIEDLPYKDFFSFIVPPGEAWVETYKAFYGLPENVVLHWE